MCPAWGNLFAAGGEQVAQHPAKGRAAPCKGSRSTLHSRRSAEAALSTERRSGEGREAGAQLSNTSRYQCRERSGYDILNLNKEDHLIVTLFVSKQIYWDLTEKPKNQ